MDSRPVLRATGTCLLLLLAVLSVDSEETSCKEDECQNFKIIRFYKQLGCTPAEGSDACCPTHFNCSPFLSLDKTKCHYRGNAYDSGTQLQDEIENKCTPSCICRYDPSTGEASFHCAHIDCPEFFHPPVDAGCYRMYEVDRCCSVGVHCENDTDVGRALIECTYNGKTYQEGQYIDVPDRQCKTCVCQLGFDGTLDGPWCRKYGCDLTLRHTPLDLSRCAPVFYGSRACCPIDWHCPSSSDIVQRVSDSEPGSEGNSCTFGDHRLNIGDTLSTSNPCIKCSCDIPPFITCTQTPQSECSS